MGLVIAGGIAKIASNSKYNRFFLDFLIVQLLEAAIHDINKLSCIPLVVIISKIVLFF